MLFRLPRVVRSIVVCPLYEEMNLDVGDLDVLNAMHSVNVSRRNRLCSPILKPYFRFAIPGGDKHA